jgi:hypothetical protein
MSQPNVAEGMLAIHRAVTRGLQVAVENAWRFENNNFPDETTQAGYFNYIRALASVLHSHHLTEDDLAFPYFKVLLPEMPVEQLSAQHQEMIPLLDAVQAALAQCEAAGGAPGELQALSTSLEKLNSLWLPHIAIEEEHFTVQRVGALLPVQEQVRLLQEFGKHTETHSGPPYLTVPFILYNLSQEMRAVMARGMPEEVTSHLVPVVWKEHWASMKPFLLD